jgi:hypothetical protein
MIAIFIFYLHLVGAVYAFSYSYVHHKLTDAFMTLAFVAVIFSVGWTVAGFIVRFTIPHGGFGIWLDSDTISLVIVTILETILYTTYFRTSKTKVQTS